MTNVETNSVDEAEFYGEVQLRWYQIAARNELAVHLRNGVKRVGIVLPTGSGKTITIACSLSSPQVRKALGVDHNDPLRVLFVAHRGRLLTQAEQTFIEDSNVELILQSVFSDIPEDVIKKGWDVSVIDEMQHEACMSIQLQLEHIGDKPIIGLSATPDRADGSLIKFERFIRPISREQAVKEGWLAETHLNTFIDTPHADKTGIISDILTHYGHEMGQTMVFVRTHAEVKNITDFLNTNGYNAVSTTGIPDTELNGVLDAFSRRECQFVVDCFRISEGVDVKGCDHILLGRQVGSYPMLNQIIGRAARPDSECHVWELVNPLSGRNLDTTVVVGEPVRHRLIYKHKGTWQEEEFNYTTHIQTIESGARAQRRHRRRR